MTNTTTTRATVDFSGPSRATARSYAEVMPSRVLDAKHNQVLRDVAKGKTVDAYALNEAVTAAMRSGATRFGQSMSRREFTRKVAYLGHIVQAVLEAAADDLPTYEDGVARSRAIVEAREGLQFAKREVDHAAQVNQSLTRDLTAERARKAEAVQQVVAERRTAETLRGEIAALKDAAAAERRRLVAEINFLLTQRGDLQEQSVAVAAFREGYAAREAGR